MDFGEDGRRGEDEHDRPIQGVGDGDGSQTTRRREDVRVHEHLHENCFQTDRAREEG